MCCTRAPPSRCRTRSLPPDSLSSKNLPQGSLPPRASLKRAFLNGASFQRSSNQIILFKGASLQRAFLNETSRQRASLESTRKADFKEPFSSEPPSRQPPFKEPSSTKPPAREPLLKEPSSREPPSREAAFLNGPSFRMILAAEYVFTTPRRASIPAWNRCPAGFLRWPWGSSGYIWVLRSPRHSPHVLRTFPGHSPGMSGNVRECPGMSGNVRVCPGMSGNVRGMCGECPGNVRRMSGNVREIPTLVYPENLPRPRPGLRPHTAQRKHAPAKQRHYAYTSAYTHNIYIYARISLSGNVRERP